jgi:hypothetical protein
MIGTETDFVARVVATAVCMAQLSSTIDNDNHQMDSI